MSSKAWDLFIFAIIVSLFPIFVMCWETINRSLHFLQLRTKPSETIPNTANFKTKPAKTLQNSSKPIKSICCTSKPKPFF